MHICRTTRILSLSKHFLRQTVTALAFGILFICLLYEKENTKPCSSVVYRSSIRRGLLEKRARENSISTVKYIQRSGELESQGKRLVRNSTNALEPWAVKSRPDVIVTYVQSSAVNGYRRYLIRKTWGDKSVRHGEYHIQPMFVIGRHELHVKHPESILDLHEENRQHGDIYYVPDVLDTYDNLTLKEIKGKRWISKHYPDARYVLKADDDAFINTRLWIKEVEKLDTEFYKPMCRNRECIICKLWIDPMAFCSGSGYLMTKESLDALVKAVRTVELFKRDDRYFTGFVRKKTKVRLINTASRFYYLHSPFDRRRGPQTLDFLLLHNYTLNRWESLWYDIMHSRLPSNETIIEDDVSDTIEGIDWDAY